MATGSWGRRTSTASLSVKVKPTLITERPLNFTVNDCELFIKSWLIVSTVITSKDLKKCGYTWVCPISDHVCTRFLFVWVKNAAAVRKKNPPCSYSHCSSKHWPPVFLLRYENGQIGDLWVNTQDTEINQEILQVIVSRHCWPSDPACLPTTSVFVGDWLFVCMLLCFVSWTTGTF